jgi:hypothetical protein
MDFVYTAFRMVFGLTFIVAIVLPWLSGNRLCVFLTSHQPAPNTWSVSGPLLQAVHGRVCGQGWAPPEQGEWNLFYHLGGNGPWIEMLDSRFGSYRDEGKPPEGCVVDQVHMV